MPKKESIFSWIVFSFSLGAYAPLMVGGWKHPYEINVACFSLWIILAAMITWSSRTQGFAGWRMQFAFLWGNTAMVSLALFRGGFTFNLGLSEIIVFYGMVTTIGIWVAVGQITKKWKPSILYLGGIAADVLSFYPQLKQYLLPHEQPTDWMIFGWIMFGLGSFLNFILVERLPVKLLMDEVAYRETFETKKDYLSIFEESAFSLENFLLISITVVIMCR